MYSNSIYVLLSLIRKALLGLDVRLPSFINWQEVMRLASMHGLTAIAFDGIEGLASSSVDITKGDMALTEIPKPIKLQWAAQSLRQETIFKQNWELACGLSELWESYGIEALVLKGRSIAQFYPKPQHRYSCDLDVFIPGDDWKKACDVLETQDIHLCQEVYKEVEFTYNGLYVECHRYITPVRGNKTLLRFDKYLRSILEDFPIDYFEDTALRCPPLLFIVLLFIEHALGDLLHGRFSLKHITDWVVIRRQDYDSDMIAQKCEEFGFDRFLNLLDTLADVVEGKVNVESLPVSYKEVFDSFFVSQSSDNKPKSWFVKRVSLFFEIIENRNYYRNFGYCSMSDFLLNAVWSHFFHKKVLY